MKKIIIIISALLALQTIKAQGIHSFTVPKIESGTQALSAFTGKTLLIVTLPLSQTAAADSILQQLDTLATNRAASLKVIAVPAYEDGFTTAQKTALRTWYRSKLNTNIVITDGLRTRKTSGSQQHGLFQWLTKVSSNTVFDIDVAGPGYQFFVKANGDLFGVLLPHSKPGSAMVQRTLNMQ
jgi:glutathione peroxidase-family protein